MAALARLWRWITVDKYTQLDGPASDMHKRRLARYDIEQRLRMPLVGR